MIKIPLKAAKPRLFDLVRKIERSPQHIILTRGGLRVAALVPYRTLAVLDYLATQQLEAAAAELRPIEAAAAALESPAKRRGSTSPSRTAGRPRSTRRH